MSEQCCQLCKSPARQSFIILKSYKTSFCEENGTKFPKMTNCLKFPRGLKICNLVSKCQYIHEHSKFLSSDGKNVLNLFFLEKRITEVTFWFPQVSSRYHANFLPMLIKINNIQSIKKPFCLSLSDFHSTYFLAVYQSERISLLVSIYFGTINHQDNS